VGATWCGSCKAYKRSLPDPRMVEAHAGVTILEVDAERHARTLDTLGITPAGVPHWEVLDRAGRPVGRHIDGSAWTLNTVGSMAPALSAFFQGG
jgi:thiol:disulfide interchange protein